MSIEQNLQQACQCFTEQKYDAAQDLFHKLTLRHPKDPRPWQGLGVSLHVLGDSEQAIVALEKALALDPKQAQIYYNLALCYQNLTETVQAQHCYEKAIALAPGYGIAYENLATLHYHQGDFDAAQRAATQALKVNPESVNGQWNMAIARLGLGDFAGGWSYYEAGLKNGERALYQTVDVKRWTGEPLTGTLLVVAEGGLGDNLFFATCLTDLLKTGYCIQVLGDRRLCQVLAPAFPAIQFSDKLTDVGEIEAHIPIGSLPARYRCQLSDFPEHTAYLEPQSEHYETCCERYQDFSGLKVGVSWQTQNPKFARNNLPLAQWQGVFAVPGCHFIDLQYGDTKVERSQSGAALYHDGRINPLTDLPAFVAQVAQCDVILTTDNSTATLGGALGVPTWVLLPKGCNYRWQQRGSASPWFASIRLFRARETMGDQLPKLIDALAHF